MTFIKHKDKFYREINLEELSKEELIQIITEAIEVKDEVIIQKEYVKNWDYDWRRKGIVTCGTHSPYPVKEILYNAPKNDLISICESLST